ncbi:MAG: hypothetical protein AAFV32_02900 [Myxococcota bacterium]
MGGWEEVNQKLEAFARRIVQAAPTETRAAREAAIKSAVEDMADNIRELGGPSGSQEVNTLRNQVDEFLAGPLWDSINSELQHDSIASALRRLTQPEGFIVVRRIGGPEFVQLALDSRGVFLDVPVQTLNAQQMSRTARFFRTLDVTIDTVDLRDEPGGDRSGAVPRFRKHFGEEFDLACNAALSAIKTITALDVIDLEVNVDWSFSVIA